MLFCPFSGSDKPEFFRIPASENNGSFGLPTGLEQFTNSVNGFEHRSGATVGINGPENPGVAMIARNNPGIGRFASRNFSSHIPDCAVLIILFEMHFYFYRPWSNVVS